MYVCKKKERRNKNNITTPYARRTRKARNSDVTHLPKIPIMRVTTTTYYIRNRSYIYRYRTYIAYVPLTNITIRNYRQSLIGEG